MTISMYKASVPVISHNLKALSGILGKASAEMGHRELEVLDARLAPDMFKLMEQLRFILLHAKLTPSLLAGVDVPKLAPNDQDERSLVEVQANLGAALDYLKTFKPDQIDGSEMRPVELVTYGGETVRFTGERYLLGFALPNFFFHYSMAYGILRANGLEIGKHDFLGG